MTSLRRRAGTTTRCASPRRTNEWRVVDPLEARADFGLVEAMIGRLGSGEMIAIESESAADDALEPFGLDRTPAFTATVEVGGESYTLLVGDEKPGDHCLRPRRGARPRLHHRRRAGRRSGARCGYLPREGPVRLPPVQRHRAHRAARRPDDPVRDRDRPGRTKIAEGRRRGSRRGGLAARSSRNRPTSSARRWTPCCGRCRICVRIPSSADRDREPASTCRWLPITATFGDDGEEERVRIGRSGDADLRRSTATSRAPPSWTRTRSTTRSKRWTPSTPAASAGLTALRRAPGRARRRFSGPRCSGNFQPIDHCEACSGARGKRPAPFERRCIPSGHALFLGSNRVDSDRPSLLTGCLARAGAPVFVSGAAAAPCRRRGSLRVETGAGGRRHRHAGSIPLPHRTPTGRAPAPPPGHGFVRARPGSPRRRRLMARADRPGNPHLASASRPAARRERNRTRDLGHGGTGARPRTSDSTPATPTCC